MKDKAYRITHILKRSNGTQIKLVASSWNLDFTDVKIDIFYKDRGQENWCLVSKDPIIEYEKDNFKNSGLKDCEFVNWYKIYGKPEYLYKITMQEFLIFLSLIGKPIRDVEKFLANWEYKKDNLKAQGER